MYESQKRAIEKYRKNKIERCVLDVPKGTKDMWKSYANSKGISLASLIKNLMKEAMDADGFSYEMPDENSDEK